MSEDTCGISTRITYKDLIDRGFKRIKVDDEVHFNQRGYKCFLVVKEFEFSKVEFSFNECNLSVDVYLINDSGFILNTVVLKDIATLDSMLDEIDSLEQVLRFGNKKLKELFKQ